MFLPVRHSLLGYYKKQQRIQSSEFQLPSMVEAIPFDSNEDVGLCGRLQNVLVSGKHQPPTANNISLDRDEVVLEAGHIKCPDFVVLHEAESVLFRKR